MDLRKLDALVAEHVMQLQPQVIEHQHPYLGTFIVDQTKMNREAWTPNYSTDISAAWEVAKKIGLVYMTVNCESGKVGGISQFHCRFEIDGNAYYANGLTTEIAICLAALKAKGIDVSEWE